MFSFHFSKRAIKYYFSYSDFNQNENYDISSTQDESCDKNKNEEFKEEKKK